MILQNIIKQKRLKLTALLLMLVLFVISACGGEPPNLEDYRIAQSHQY